VLEYGYQKALGRFSDRFDIENAVGTSAEQKTASLLMYISVFSIPPIIAFLALLFVVRAKRPGGMKQILACLMLFVGSFAVFPIVIDQKFPTLSTAALLRTATDFAIRGPIASGKWASSVTGVTLQRRPVKKPDLPDDTLPSNNVIVVLGESIMGDHLSLNGYPRETTPFLDGLARQNLLHNWRISASASTGTRFSYGVLITGLSPDDFPDRTETKVNTWPTIFQYAKAMNYKTHFFDAQMNQYWCGTADDRNYIDDFQGILDISDHLAFETWNIDQLAAKKVRDLISRTTGNFIFVFTHGSHIPYQSNFPPDAAVWSPSYEAANKYDIPPGEKLPQVTNAYDNSVRYAVESFFTTLMNGESRLPNNSVLLYTGDHGQTLFANGRSSHGGNTKAEATVPLFMMGNLPVDVDTGYRASHGNIFPTILDLIGYPQQLRETPRFPSLLSARAADSHQRFFNPDLGRKVPFD
jgi:glucan phosphoethanolaminetransferase (alkaline phosphatase superfamily)